MYFTVSDFPAKGNALTTREMADLASLAEEVGLDRFGVTDFPFHQNCLPVMTACLLRTSRIEVESLVTSPFHRMPDVTACAWATMSELSGGRVILGIGKGGQEPPLWAPPWGRERPNEREAVRDLITMCRTMWRGDAPPSEGRVLRASGLPLEFTVDWPIPILVAARGPKMLRVGAEMADIVHIATPFVGRDYMTSKVDWVRECADQAGRDPGKPEIDLTVSWCVMTDRRQARDFAKLTTAAAIQWIEPDAAGAYPVPPSTVKAIREGWNMWTGEPLPAELSDLITDELLDAFSIAGELDECHERLADLIEAVPGITGIRFKLPPLTGRESFDQFQEIFRLTGQVAAKLRERGGPT